MTTYRSSLPGSKLGKPFLYVIVKMHLFMLSMFLYYTPSRGELYILHLYLITLVFIMRGSRKFFQRESNFDNVLFFR